MKRKILVGAVILIVVVVFAVLKTHTSKLQNQSSVQTTTLSKTSITKSVLVSGVINSKNTQDVYSKVTAYPIREVYCKVGDKVKAGDILARIDTTSQQQDIKQTELNIKNSEDTLKNEEQTNKYNLLTASNNLKSTELDLEKAQEDYNRIKEPYEEGASTDTSFTNAKSALVKAQIAYDNALASLNNTKDKNTDSSIDNIEIQKSNLDKQKLTLKDSIIRAPINGTVTMVNAKPDAMASGLLFVIEDTDNLVVVSDIGEYDIPSVKLGQSVIIKADSLGNKEFSGNISNIAPTSIKDGNGNTAASSNVQFETEVTIKDKDPELKIGMNVRLTVIVKEKKNVYAVPIEALVKASDGKNYIYAENASDNSNGSKSVYRKILVEKGMETDTYVEISSPALMDGMMVQTNPTESAE